MATTVALLQPTMPAPRNPREWQRVSVSLPAELFSLEGQRLVLVVNLCAQGAMVEMTLPPRLGSEVMLFCGGIETGGSIVWQRPQHCGVRFHAPVDEADIDSEALWSRTTLQRLLAR
jgi:hypothetical protein